VHRGVKFFSVQFSVGEGERRGCLEFLLNTEN
jgi:hypothetical protein